MKKYIVNILEDNNKTIVTRYLKENFLMKSKFFILLYSIYLIYVRIYIYKFNLDFSLMKKVSIETSFHFLVLYFIILLVKSKEIMVLEKEKITIRKFFTFICYQTNKINHSLNKKSTESHSSPPSITRTINKTSTKKRI